MRRLVILLLVVGCGDSGPQIEDLPIVEQVTLTGLTAPVDVVRDKRGAPHIYGATLGDVVRVQGYLMARDRFGQMEFFRLLVLGRLAEIFGAVSAGTIDMDRDARFVGYGRWGRAIFDGLSPGDPSRQVAESFVAGVNAYIDEIKRATDKSPYIPPGAELLTLIYNSPYFGPWDPADVFALARFQAANLSYDPDTDVERSRALAGVRAAFGEDPTQDRRAAAFVDLFSEVQARRVYTSSAFPQALAARRRAPPLATPGVASLDGALAFLHKHRDLNAQFHGEGSNNWIVSGSKTASGAPLLANDPHLALLSPAVWWYAHLNTRRAGGDIDVAGVAFAALPGVVLGFNEDIAWGATTTAYDVTDVYRETVVGDAVSFNGSQVPIQTMTETIRVAGQADQTLTIEVVPHHGSIIPGSRVGGEALSIRYTGQTPSNELAFFLGLTTAKTVDEAWAAQASFRVGSQNFVVVTRGGDIAWNTEARIPLRDPRALTLDIDARGIVSGYCPTFVLPGTGEYEWVGDLDSRFIPKERNPTRGFIATANQDNVGVTDDGNPCNDDHYIGGGFADGLREGRIVERLTTLTARGGITAADMIAVQAETQSQLGDTLRDPFVASLGRVVADANAPFTAQEKVELGDARARLMAWSRQTPHGVGATGATDIADSVATTIFNVAVTRIIPLAFQDEGDAIGVRPPSDRAAALLERAVNTPQMLATYDTALGDTVLWDNIDTPAAETKDLIIARGFLDALAFLKGKLGQSVDDWRWGRLHTVRFSSVIPAFGQDQVSIPVPGDVTYPDGFPRHGDFGAVDVGNFSLWAPQNFNHGAGSSQRLVVEMLPDGPRAYNALPGGQVLDPRSPHHADEAQFWIKNEQPPVFFHESDVVQNAEARLKFVP